jgi:hypothetical protein
VVDEATTARNTKAAPSHPIEGVERLSELL